MSRYTIFLMSEVVSGQLERLGLEEVEPGIVLDTLENRRRLQLQEEVWTWERVRDESDELTGLIRPISPQLRETRRESILEQRQRILSDPSDAWSDYVHPDSYPLDIAMPWWVEMRLRGWREQADSGVPEEERRRFPVRCTQLRTDNTRCWNWVGNPDKITLCKSHTYQTREAITRTPAYARERIIEASVGAVDNLIQLADHAEGEAVRLKANTEILDRAGVRGGVEVDVSGQVTHVDPGTALQDRLQKLAKRHAEQITEEPEGPPPPALESPEVVEAELVPEETA